MTNQSSFGASRPQFGQRIAQGGLLDFWVEVGLGRIPGYSTFIIRGHNPDLDTGVEEDVWEGGGDLSYLTTAEKMNVSSSSADDAVAGTGLRALLLSGVGDAGEALSETIIMNGTSDVLSVQSYLRINQLLGLGVGSAGWNVGTITAVADTAASNQCQMAATESISQNSHYTVALRQKFLLVQVELNCANNVARDIDFKGMARIGGAGMAWIQLFDKALDTGVTDEIDVLLPFGFAAPERTDIRFRAVSTGNNSEVRTRMYALVVDL